jgi:hypothetical protein
MRRRASFAAYAVACLAAGSAAAQGLDPAKLCVDGRVAPGRLLNSAFALSKAPFVGIGDVNRDGTDELHEKASAALDRDYCKGAGKGLCKPGDQLTLNNIHQYLETFAGDPRIAIVPLASPGADDIAAWPLLASEPLAMLFDNRGRFAEIRCTLPAASAGTAPSSGLPSPKPEAEGGWRFASAFRLSKTADGLGLARGSKEKLAAVPQAEISYVDNRIAGTETFSIAAVVGLELLNDPNQQLIPFLSYTRKSVSGSATAGNASQLGLGFTYSAFLESFDQIDMTGLVTLDDKDDSAVGAGHFSWTPAFLQQLRPLPFDAARRVGPVWVKFNLKAIAHAGYVFDAGANAALTDGEGYLRAGAEGKALIWLLPESAVFSHVTADASYKHLFRIAGPQRVTWLDIGLNYQFDEEGHWILRYSFERGDDDETLKRTDQWKLSLGVRY